MGEYIKDISHIVTEAEALAMIERADNPRDKFLVAFLYLTGARPSEILELEDKDFSPEVQGYVAVRVVTKKHGKTGNMLSVKRTLELPLSSPFIPHILTWVRMKTYDECSKCHTPKVRGNRLVQIGRVHLWWIIDNLSDHKICPYHFRHSRLTKLSNSGASLTELMYWKGGLTLKSVEPYIRNKPIGRKLVLE